MKTNKMLLVLVCLLCVGVVGAVSPVGNVTLDLDQNVTLVDVGAVYKPVNFSGGGVLVDVPSNVAGLFLNFSGFWSDGWDFVGNVSVRFGSLEFVVGALKLGGECFFTDWAGSALVTGCVAEDSLINFTSWDGSRAVYRSFDFRPVLFVDGVGFGLGEFGWDFENVTLVNVSLGNGSHVFRLEGLGSVQEWVFVVFNNLSNNTPVVNDTVVVLPPEVDIRVGNDEDFRSGSSGGGRGGGYAPFIARDVNSSNRTREITTSPASDYNDDLPEEVIDDVVDEVVVPVFVPPVVYNVSAVDEGVSVWAYVLLVLLLFFLLVLALAWRQYARKNVLGDEVEEE